MLYVLYKMEEIKKNLTDDKKMFEDFLETLSNFASLKRRF